MFNTLRLYIKIAFGNVFKVLVDLKKQVRQHKITEEQRREHAVIILQQKIEKKVMQAACEHMHGRHLVEVLLEVEESYWPYLLCQKCLFKVTASRYKPTTPTYEMVYDTSMFERLRSSMECQQFQPLRFGAPLDNYDKLNTKQQNFIDGCTRDITKEALEQRLQELA